jgi:hypothetical protein
MGLTVVPHRDSYQSLGKLIMCLADITFDSSYAAGGETITPAMVALRGIYGAHLIAGTVALMGYIPVYLKSGEVSGGKLIVNAGFGGVRCYNASHFLGADAEDADKENADSAVAQTNQAVIGAAETFTTMAGHSLAKSHTITLQPDVPRNVVIYIHNDTGGDLNLYEGVTTFTVTGTFRGVAQVDLITFTSTSGNKKMEHAPDYRWKAGVKPFDKITSIVYDNGAAATMKCSVGPGIRFGLPTDPMGNLEASIFKLAYALPSSAAAVDKTITSTYNTSYKTVNIGAVADYGSLMAWYASSAEVPAGTDLSAQTFRMMFIGV